MLFFPLGFFAACSTGLEKITIAHTRNSSEHEYGMLRSIRKVLKNRGRRVSFINASKYVKTLGLLNIKTVASNMFITP